MLLRTLIVDDEPIARKVLREELDSIPDVEVVGEADNGSAALERIAACHPQLVLLDLQMPVMGGLEVVRNLKDRAHIPVIVIVTAYDNHALAAFEAGAIDYLLKPVSRERLVKAVERAAHVTSREALNKLTQLQQLVHQFGEEPRAKVVGRIEQEYFLLGVQEIYAFQAEGDLVWIITAQRKYRATQTLKELESRLKKCGFCRIHRNALVNMDHVRKVSTLSSQRWLITLTNNQEFIASKRQAREVRDLFRW